MKEPSIRKGKSLNILVLDDHPRWREIVKSILETDLGVSPILASSGPEALDIVKARPIDVVVTDLHMPVMDGIQFLDCVRPQSPKTKIIMMSADFGDYSAMSEVLIARGAFAVICKVKLASKLVNLLRTLKRSK